LIKEAKKNSGNLYKKECQKPRNLENPEFCRKMCNSGHFLSTNWQKISLFIKDARNLETFIKDARNLFGKKQYIKEK
jgi:hypothetical protein